MTSEGHSHVLLLLTVPAHWPELPVDEIERKLAANAPRIRRFLAGEIQRWGNREELDVDALRAFVDDLEAGGA